MEFFEFGLDETFIGKNVTNSRQDVEFFDHEFCSKVHVILACNMGSAVKSNTLIKDNSSAKPNTFRKLLK